MNKKLIKFCFKGNRNYIQGGDIFNNLVEFVFDKLYVDELINLDMSFHKLLENNMYIYIFTPKDDISLVKDNVNVVFRFKTNLKGEFLILGVESDIPVNCRYEYYEEKIYNLSMLNLKNKEIILNQDTGYTFIENIIAMNKYLLTKLFKTEKMGKWYFVKLELDNYKQSCNFYPLKLQLKSNLGLNLVKTYINSNATKGYIYFSLRKI